MLLETQIVSSKIARSIDCERFKYLSFFLSNRCIDSYNNRFTISKIILYSLLKKLKIQNQLLRMDMMKVCDELQLLSGFHIHQISIRMYWCIYCLRCRQTRFISCFFCSLAQFLVQSIYLYCLVFHFGRVKKSLYHNHQKKKRKKS